MTTVQKFVAVESLRGWMAWWVVLGHAVQLSGMVLPEAQQSLFAQRVFNFATNGNTAVKVFIIISGFVITHVLIESKTTYGVYIFRRACRIVPIYLFALVLAVLTTKLYFLAFVELPYASGREMRLDRLQEQAENFGTHLSLHLLLLHGLIPENILKYSSSTFLTPAWSLSLEWQFYLVAPALVALLTRKLTLILITTFCILGLSALALHGAFGTWQFPAFLPLSLNGFLVGIFSRAAMNIRVSRFRPDLLTVLAATFLLADVGEALIWLLFYIIVLYEAGRLTIQSKPIHLFAKLMALNRYTSALGRWSYSTYLLHIPVFSVIVGGYAFYVGTNNSAHGEVIALMILAVPMVLVLSWLAYTAIEQPIIIIGRRWNSVINYNNRP